jgi:hypothetical protein
VLLYRDREMVHHVPLQAIYETCTAAEYFIQKETWGTDFKHMFIGGESMHAIIDAKDVSRAVMLDHKELKPENQGHRSYDIKKGKMGINVFQGIRKGTSPVIPITDSQKTSASIDFTTMINNAIWYAHYTKSRPQYLVRVPLNTGINITVGEGCDLTFTPPHTKPNSSNAADGLYLITDLIHEVHNDLREVLGTTTINALLRE